MEAAQRELQEETGLYGTFMPVAGSVQGTPNGLIAYEEHSAGSKGLHMNFCFLADVDSRQVRPNAEYTEFRWIAHVDEAAEAPLNVRQIISRIL